MSAAVCLGAARHRGHLQRHKPTSPIAGSHQSQLNQNAEIDRLRLPRIVDDNQLEQLERDGELVRISSQYIDLEPATDSRRFARVWTVKFVTELARQFNQSFRQRVPVSSAVRTEEQQRKLRLYNRFAAPPTESSHVAGVTVDIAKRTLTPAQRKWLVAYLKYYRDMGIIEAVEEPYCYHVAVMERYLEYAEDK